MVVPPEALWDARLGYFGIRPAEVGELTPAQLIGCVDLFRRCTEASRWRAPLSFSNLAALSKTFKKAPKDVRLAYRRELRTIAQPVQAAAESLAAARIRNLATGEPWARFRIGITQRLVYVAPRQKGVRGASPGQRKPSSPACSRPGRWSRRWSRTRRGSSASSSSCSTGSTRDWNRGP